MTAGLRGFRCLTRERVFKMVRQAASRIFRLMVILFMFIHLSCNDTKPEKNSDVQSERFNVRSVAKSDINQMMDIYVAELRDQLRLLMDKLYKRNPRELSKSSFATAEENIQRLFSRTNNWFFRELNDVQGIEAMELSFDPEYSGDRVFAFVAGLTSMIMSSYKNKTDFYLYDNIDPQTLYNSARNIEIAAWKLSTASDVSGELLIYSNSMQDEEPNHSYANLFGKMTELQDTMAVMMANKTNRTISKIIQRLATAVFLPIP